MTARSGTSAMPGLSVAEEYATGVSEGVLWAEQDLSEGGGHVSCWLAAFKADADVTGDRAHRARMLGVLRGYRSVVRTQLGGRWGT